MPRDERSKEILRELAKLNPEDPRAELWKERLKKFNYKAYEGSPRNSLLNLSRRAWLQGSLLGGASRYLGSVSQKNIRKLFLLCI